MKQANARRALALIASGREFTMGDLMLRLGLDEGSTEHREAAESVIRSFAKLGKIRRTCMGSKTTLPIYRGVV